MRCVVSEYRGARCSAGGSVRRGVICGGRSEGGLERRGGRRKQAGFYRRRHRTHRPRGKRKVLVEAERERTTSASPSSNSLQRFAPSSSHPSFANSSHLRSRRERCPLRSRPLPRTLPPRLLHRSLRLARDSLHRPRIDAADAPSRAPLAPQVQRKLARAADKAAPASAEAGTGECGSGTYALGPRVP